MVRSDDDTTVADVVTVVADDLDLGGGDVADGLAVEWVAEDEDCRMLDSSHEGGVSKRLDIPAETLLVRVVLSLEAALWTSWPPWL